MRRLSLIAYAVLVMLALTSTAGASTFEIRDTTLVFTGTGAEPNRISLDTDNVSEDFYAGGELAYVVYDVAGSPVTPGNGCKTSPYENFSARCQLPPVKTIAVALGGGDDSVLLHRPGCEPPCEFDRSPPVPASVDGGPGNDTLVAGTVGGTMVGGPGQDSLRGDAGPDVIDARDGEADAITCGAGFDSVVADAADVVARDCESVDNGIETSPPGPVGVSINQGAQFTNRREVSLSLRWPRLASQLFADNDGGFASVRTFTVARSVPWTLDSSGPERLPKTVYVRFAGGESGPETYQDDIILDETRPTLTSVTLLAGGAPGLHQQPSGAAHHPCS